MDFSFFVRGLLIGLSIAATVGPMSILCIQRTLNKGQLYGLVSGLGIATADGVYGSIAAFGLTLITSFLIHEQIWIRLIGGLFLVYLGVKTILTNPPERAAVNMKTNSYPGAYTTTFLLTLTNPLTILSFRSHLRGNRSRVAQVKTFFLQLRLCLEYSQVQHCGGLSSQVASACYEKK